MENEQEITVKIKVPVGDRYNKEQIVELQTKIDSLEMDRETWNDQYGGVKAENERAKEALEFYADEKNYKQGTYWNDTGQHLSTERVMNDRGKKARGVLNDLH